MKTLPRILALHRRRLAEAQTCLRERRLELRTREQYRNRCRDALDEHRMHAPDRERAIYAGVLGSVVTHRELDLAKHLAMEIQREEAHLEEVLEQAERDVDEALDLAEEARLAYKRQEVRTEKYVQLCDLVSAAEASALQYKEELEAEEMGGAKK
jgi:hypothetical protein